MSARVWIPTVRQVTADDWASRPYPLLSLPAYSDKTGGGICARLPLFRNPNRARNHNRPMHPAFGA
jgi:hypothetical protein